MTRRFGDHVALQPTDLDVRPGEALALVGPNGAGKSTLLAILAGALEPSEGTVERAEGVRAGWMPQRPAHYGRLSPRQNLELFARLEGAGDPELSCSHGSSCRPTTVRRRRSPSATASGSTWRSPCSPTRTCCCSTSRPRRSTRASGGGSGRPPAVSATRGGAVVLVTQNLEDLEHVADRVAALLDGRVVFDGPVADYLTSEAAGALELRPALADPAQGPARPAALAGAARRPDRLPARDRAPDRADRRLREREAARRLRRPGRDPAPAHGRRPDVQHRPPDRRRGQERRDRPDVRGRRRRSSSPPAGSRRW